MVQPRGRTDTPDPAAGLTEVSSTARPAWAASSLDQPAWASPRFRDPGADRPASQRAGGATRSFRGDQRARPRDRSLRAAATAPKRAQRARRRERQRAVAAALGGRSSRGYRHRARGGTTELAQEPVGDLGAAGDRREPDRGREVVDHPGQQLGARVQVGVAAAEDADAGARRAGRPRAPTRTRSAPSPRRASAVGQLDGCSTGLTGTGSSATTTARGSRSPASRASHSALRRAAQRRQPGQWIDLAGSGPDPGHSQSHRFPPGPPPARRPVHWRNGARRVVLTPFGARIAQWSRPPRDPLRVAPLSFRDGRHRRARRAGRR